MYEAVDAVLIRAAARPLTAPQPPWPNLGGNTSGDVERWREWIGEVWADEALVAAIEVASPLLVAAVHGVLDGRNQRPRTVRRAVISLMRYLLRTQHRATPFGLFAAPRPYNSETAPRCDGVPDTGRPSERTPSGSRRSSPPWSRTPTCCGACP